MSDRDVILPRNTEAGSRCQPTVESFIWKEVPQGQGPSAYSEPSLNWSPMPFPISRRRFMLPRHYLKWEALLKPEPRKVYGRNPSGEVGRAERWCCWHWSVVGPRGTSRSLMGPGTQHVPWSRDISLAAPEHTGCLINSCSVSRRIDSSQFIK